MEYTQENVLVSVMVHLATHLRADGWNVFWHSSGQTEAYTTGPEKGTVTLVQAIPDTPTFITQGTRTNSDEIVLPALAVQVTPTRRIQRYGMGDNRHIREISVRVGGLASTGREQRMLATSMIEWSDVGETNVDFPLQDYSNPATPVDLEPATLWWAQTTTPEISTEQKNVRFQINTELILQYVE